MKWPGEKQAWDILSALDVKDVEINAGTVFNPHNSTYQLICFGQFISISLESRQIYSESEAGKLLLEELGQHSRVSIIKYLTHARDLPFSGQLVGPSGIPGGDMLERGIHSLPLDKLAECFDNKTEEFISVGNKLAGSQLEHGDVALKLSPFPRVPVIIILWSGDEEFPTKSTLLFDSSCILQLPIDVLWSIAMMTVEMMRLNATARQDGHSRGWFHR
jgi:hypothetical protein